MGKDEGVGEKAIRESEERQAAGKQKQLTAIDLAEAKSKVAQREQFLKQKRKGRSLLVKTSPSQDLSQSLGT